MIKQFYSASMSNNLTCFEVKYHKENERGHKRFFDGREYQSGKTANVIHSTAHPASSGINFVITTRALVLMMTFFLEIRHFQ
jgi:hypothetical protein